MIIIIIIIDNNNKKEITWRTPKKYIYTFQRFIHSLQNDSKEGGREMKKYIQAGKKKRQGEIEMHARQGKLAQI